MGRRTEEERRRAPTWGCLPGRRRSPWAAALLAAAVLSSGFLLGRAQEIPVTVEPSQPSEGQDVTLTPGGTQGFFFCHWYRGEPAEANRILTYVRSSLPLQRNGSGFTGRETGGPGCSLHIGSLMLNDTGVYVVTKTATEHPETGRVHIEVSGARRRKNKSSKEMDPTSPVYENTRPSAQTQVVPGNSSEINST